MFGDLPAPTFLSSDFALSPTSPEDIEGIISCHHAAFNTPEERYWWSQDLDAQRAFQRKSIERNLGKPDRRYYKIVHKDSGRIASWASWMLPKGLDRFAGASAAEGIVIGGGKEVADVSKNDEYAGLSPREKARKIVEQIDPPGGACREALEDIIKLEEEMHERYDVGKKIFLACLCTDPDFERRGLARALVEPMLVAAAAEGVPVWLDGSAKGVGFYKKMGFESIELSGDIDLSKGNKGLSGTTTWTSMQWTPRKFSYEYP